MPAKPRSNSEKIDLVYTTVKKHSKKIDMVCTTVKKHSEKIDMVCTTVKKHSQDIAELKGDVVAVKEQLSVLDQRQQRFEERQDRFEENQKRVEGGLLQAFSDFKNAVWELYVKQDQKIERALVENAKFKDDILTAVDRVAQMFGDFNLEKKALGLKQDRIESTQNRMEAEIEALQDSDQKQNRALASLETRVEFIEAKPR